MCTHRGREQQRLRRERKDLRPAAGRGPVGPLGRPWGKQCLPPSATQDGVPFPLPHCPQSPHQPVTRKFSTSSPSRCRLEVHIACPPLSPCRLHVRTRAHQHRQHHALGHGSFMLPLKGITLHLQKTAPIPTLLSQYPTTS